MSVAHINVDMQPNFFPPIMGQILADRTINLTRQLGSLGIETIHLGYVDPPYIARVTQFQNIPPATLEWMKLTKCGIMLPLKPFSLVGLKDIPSGYGIIRDYIRTHHVTDFIFSGGFETQCIAETVEQIKHFNPQSNIIIAAEATDYGVMYAEDELKYRRSFFADIARVEPTEIILKEYGYVPPPARQEMERQQVFDALHR